MKFGTAVARLAQAPLVLLSPSNQTTTEPPFRPGLRSSFFSPEFDKLVHRSMSDLHVPGMAVAIVNGSDTFSRVSSRLHTLDYPFR